MARLASLAAIESERRLGKKVTKETRYFISSLTGNVQHLPEAARKHWASRTLCTGCWTSP